MRDIDIQTSGAGDAMFEDVPGIVDLTRKIDELIGKVSVLQMQANTIIAAVPESNYQSVLSYRCILCLSWRDIAETICYNNIRKEKTTDE